MPKSRASMRVGWAAPLLSIEWPVGQRRPRGDTRRPIRRDGGECRSSPGEMLECHVLRRRPEFRQADRSQRKQGVDEHGAADQMQFHVLSHRVGGCLDDTIVERLAVDGDYEQVNLVTKEYARLHIVSSIPLENVGECPICGAV